MFEPQLKTDYWNVISLLWTFNLLLFFLLNVMFTFKKEFNHFLKLHEKKLPDLRISNREMVISLIFNATVTSFGAALWKITVEKTTLPNHDLYLTFIKNFVFFLFSYVFHLFIVWLLAYSLGIRDFFSLTFLFEKPALFILSVAFLLLTLWVINLNQLTEGYYPGLIFLTLLWTFVEFKRILFLLGHVKSPYLIFFLYICTGVILPGYILIKFIF